MTSKNVSVILCLVMVLSSLAFCGCHFFGPRDMTPFTAITDMAQLKDLNGVWKATSFTSTGFLECRDKYSCFNVFHGRETCKGK